MKRLMIFLCFFFFVPFLSAQDVVFPHFVIGGGYETLLVIANRAEIPWTGEILFLQGANTTFQYPIELDGAELRLNEIDLTLFPFQLRELRFQSSDPVCRIGYILIHTQDSSSNDILATLFYRITQIGEDSVKFVSESVGIQPALTLRRVIIPVTVEPGTDTALAWALPRCEGVSPFWPRLTLIDESGYPLDDRTVKFTGQMAKFVSELMGIPRNFKRGILLIETSYPMCFVAFRMDYSTHGTQYTSITIK